MGRRTPGYIPCPRRFKLLTIHPTERAKAAEIEAKQKVKAANLIKDLGPIIAEGSRRRCVGDSRSSKKVSLPPQLPPCD